jgi:hypothetical protein
VKQSTLASKDVCNRPLPLVGINMMLQHRCSWLLAMVDSNTGAAGFWLWLTG